MHTKIISSRVDRPIIAISNREWVFFVKNRETLIMGLKGAIPRTKVRYERTLDPNPKQIQNPVYNTVIHNLRSIADYLNYIGTPMSSEMSASFSNRINTAVNLILEKDIFNHHPHYQADKTVRTELIHLKIASMEILLYSLLLMDNPSTIKDSFEKMMYHLNLENPCRATCLNSMMAHFLKISFTLFPKFSANLVLKRIDRFISRLSLDDVLSKKIIIRDMLHFCSRVLLEFKSIRASDFKHLKDSHLQTWDDAITFNKENQLDPRKSWEFYNKNQFEIIMLLAIMFQD